MDAASLIFLILGMIAIGVLIYYTVICFQIQRPLIRKLPSHSDMGPLLVYEDYNGNHEEPLSERAGHVLDEPDASAPKPEDIDDVLAVSGKEGLEIPLKSVTFQMTPECASKNPSNEGSVVLPIDEEPSVLDGSKSILPNPHERQMTSNTSSKEKSPIQPQIEKEPHTTITVPILISDPPRKAMSTSYEEDGLLVQGSPRSSQPEFRRILERQKSVPETHSPQPPIFIQGNPRQVPVMNPYCSGPLFIVNSSVPAGQEHRTAPRPLLKSPYSDPGTVESDSRVFIFGSKHSVEESSEQPMKKAKIASSEESNIDSRGCDTPNNSINEDSIHNNTEATNEEVPALGWVVNLPRYTKDQDKSSTLDLENHATEIEASRPPEKNASNERLSNVLLEGHDPNIDRISSENASDPELTVMSKECNINPSVMVQVFLPTDEEKDAEEPPTEPNEEDGSDSSDPDITEYSFLRGSHTPDPAVASVLLNEVSCYPDRIGLTNYVHLPEAVVNPSSPSSNERPHQIIGHPLTPTSDTTKSISPVSSNDNSLDEIPAPSFSPNVLGTPPTTPPLSDKAFTGIVIQNPSAEELEDIIPSYIEIEPHRSRLSSSASTSSSLSSTSTSSSNGSYKIDGVVDVKSGTHDTVEDKSSTKLSHLKSRTDEV